MNYNHRLLTFGIAKNHLYCINYLPCVCVTPVILDYVHNSCLTNCSNGSVSRSLTHASGHFLLESPPLMLATTALQRSGKQHIKEAILGSPGQESQTSQTTLPKMPLIGWLTHHTDVSHVQRRHFKKKKTIST